jgi:hypothetical protein
MCVTRRAKAQWRCDGVTLVSGTASGCVSVRVCVQGGSRQRRDDLIILAIHDPVIRVYAKEEARIPLCSGI